MRNLSNWSLKCLGAAQMIDVQHLSALISQMKKHEIAFMALSGCRIWLIGIKLIN